MNLYVRYFDHETLAHNVDEALDFLTSINEIKLENNTANRIITFMESSNIYPFRLKVSYTNYVLFLKTEAETLEQFKIEEKMRKENKDENRQMSMAEKKKTLMDTLNAQQPGWYEAGILFKRVIIIPETQKCQYKDTIFRVKLKADSPAHAYNRIIEHLKGRPEIDPRSQFPSVKSPNFEYKYLGEA